MNLIKNITKNLSINPYLPGNDSPLFTRNRSEIGISFLFAFIHKREVERSVIFSHKPRSELLSKVKVITNMFLFIVSDFNSVNGNHHIITLDIS